MEIRTASKHSAAEQPHNKELHLSGSLIRSFVRKLSSSRSKETMNPVFQDGKVSDASSHNLAGFGIAPVEPQQQKSDLRPSSQYKKQVRRRNHTSKPYQERVVNMAEARREIVSALKLHRASMKSSSQLQKQELLHSVQELSSLPSQMPPREFLDQVSPERDTGIYPPSGSILNCFNNTYFPSNPRASNYWSQNSNPARFKHTGSICSRSPPQVVDLNFHDLNNVTAPLINSNGEGSLPHHCMPSKPCAEIPGISYNSGHAMKNPEEIVVDKLHPVMNEDEIAAIRLIGEQHDMEWNDRVNLSTTAWWCSILKNLEKNSQEKCDTEGTMDDTGVLIEVTPWINGQQVLSESSNELRTEGIGIGLLDEMATIPTRVNCQQASDDINSQGSHFQGETLSG